MQVLDARMTSIGTLSEYPAMRITDTRTTWDNLMPPSIIILFSIAAICSDTINEYPKYVKMIEYNFDQ